MTGINLSQSNQEEDTHDKKKKIIDSGMFISIGVLIVTFVVLGGVKFYIQSIDKKISETKAQASIEAEKIKSEDVNRIADFQNRLSKVDQNISSKSDPNIAIDTVASVIMKRAYITSLSYSNQAKSLGMSIVSNDLEDMARQILTLKTSEYFKNVAMFGGYSKGDDGKVMYNVNVTLAD